MRQFLMWIRISMTFCLSKLKNNASAICFRHWWLAVVLLLCLCWRRSLLQFFGATLPSWRSKACLEINSGREYCCFSLLQVEDTSKFIPPMAFFFLSTCSPISIYLFFLSRTWLYNTKNHVAWGLWYIYTCTYIVIWSEMHSMLYVILV